MVDSDIPDKFSIITYVSQFYHLLKVPTFTWISNKITMKVILCSHVSEEWPLVAITDDNNCLRQCSDDSDNHNDNCNQGFYDVHHRHHHHFQDEDGSRSSSLIMMIMLIMIMIMIMIITITIFRMKMTQGLHLWLALLCATLCLIRFFIMIKLMMSNTMMISDDDL